MAEIQLRSVWIHLLADPGQHLEFEYRGSEVHEVSKPGEVRRHANGRRRVVTRRGLDKSLDLRIPGVSREQYATLNEWIGQTVMVRDPVGTVFYGVYFRAPGEELYPRDMLSVSLNVESVTI